MPHHPPDSDLKDSSLGRDLTSLSGGAVPELDARPALGTRIALGLLEVAFLLLVAAFMGLFAGLPALLVVILLHLDYETGVKIVAAAAAAGMIAYFFWAFARRPDTK